MKTVEQTRRELFEVWWKRSGLTKFSETAWMAFNAALDAVEIELPESELDESRAVAIEDCRAAIESTNLGIKVK